MEKLAMHGGGAASGRLLGYGRQTIDEDDVAAVADVLRSDFLTCGPATERFERAVAEAAGARYATAVANGTAALHVACLAAGIGPGDEVVVSPITFAASANCVLYCGGTPVFADIDSRTWNVSPVSESTRKRRPSLRSTSEACTWTPMRYARYATNSTSCSSRMPRTP